MGHEILTANLTFLQPLNTVFCLKDKQKLLQNQTIIINLVQILQVCSFHDFREIICYFGEIFINLVELL